VVIIVEEITTVEAIDEEVEVDIVGIEEIIIVELDELILDEAVVVFVAIAEEILVAAELFNDEVVEEIKLVPAKDEDIAAKDTGDDVIDVAVEAELLEATVATDTIPIDEEK